MLNYWTYKSYLPSGILSGHTKEGSEGQFTLNGWQVVPKNINHVCLLSNNKELIIKGRVDKLNKIMYAENIRLKLTKEKLNDQN